MGSVGALGLAPILAPAKSLAQSGAGGVLPLDTPGLDHLDIVVPDVEASARFYMSLFNTTLHGQPFQGAIRYFILLSDLGPNREVGYIAIGAANGRPTEIGHFCTAVYNYREDSAAIMETMSARFAAEGFGEFAGGGGFASLFADPDGIEIQFLPAPDVLVTAAVPSDLVTPRQGMVVPRRLDHVVLHVSDIEAAVRYYRVLYGQEAGHSHGPSRAWFEFPASNTRIILEEVPYVYGRSTGIAHFGVQVAAFDRDQVSEGLTRLGAEVVEAPDEPDVLRFRDLDGITVELVARG